MKIISVICILLGLLTPNFALSDEAPLPPSCAFEDYEILYEQDLSGLDKQEIDLFGHSAEGAGVEVYRRSGTLTVIKATFYGETGKAQYNYYFAPNEPGTYAFEFISYDYTNPLIDRDVKIAARSNNVFVVCERPYTDYFSSDAIADAKMKAIETLSVIKAELN